MPGSDWRPVVAALANAHVRAVYAALVLGQDPEAATGIGRAASRRAVATLVRAGLVVDTDSGPVIEADAFAHVLSNQPARPPRTGIERFLDRHGRIDRYPVSAADRQALLAHIARTVLRPGEIVTEKQLGERLTGFSDDTAALRRFLVDSGLVSRTASGSEYRLV